MLSQLLTEVVSNRGVFQDQSQRAKVSIVHERNQFTFNVRQQLVTNVTAADMKLSVVFAVLVIAGIAVSKYTK